MLIFVLLFISACAQRSPMDEYAIAYNVLYDRENDNYEVFSMNLDGSGKSNVTNLPGVEWTYHASGNRLFLVSDTDTAHRNYFLYEMDASGRGLRKVYGQRLADSWMSARRDGEEIIVRPHRSIDSAFHIITRRGELVRRVFTGVPNATDPAFIDDGKKIVFRGRSSRPGPKGFFVDEIFVANDDGSAVKQLTTYPAEDTSASEHAYHAGPPQWNAAEGFISYQSAQSGKYSLYAIQPDGSNQRKLTTVDMDEGWHSWSPDGKWLAIEVFDNARKQFHIGLMNWQTKEWKVLTDTTFQFQQCPVIVKKP